MDKKVDILPIPGILLRIILPTSIWSKLFVASYHLGQVPLIVSFSYRLAALHQDAYLQHNPFLLFLNSKEFFN